MSTKNKTSSTTNAKQWLEKNTGRLTLGRVMRAIRLADNIAQVDFAKTLDISRQYLCDLEHDRKEVGPKQAAKFAKKLGELESQFIRLAIQDSLHRAGLKYAVEIKKAA